MARGRQVNLNQAMLLSKHLAFYCALDTGQRRPTTDAQRHFVAVCRGRAEPYNAHERAYINYRRMCGGKTPPPPLPRPPTPTAKRPKKQPKPARSSGIAKPAKRSKRAPLADAATTETIRSRRAKRLGQVPTGPPQPSRPTPPDPVVLRRLRDLVGRGRVQSPQGAALANLQFSEVKSYQWKQIYDLVAHATNTPKVEHTPKGGCNHKVYDGADSDADGHVPGPNWFRDEDWERIWGKRDRRRQTRAPRRRDSN